MKAGILLKLFRDVISKMENMNLLTTSGDFNTPTPEQDAELASYVEHQCVGYGIEIPDKVVKVTDLLPMILSMVK